MEGKNMRELILLAHVPTESVNEGFLPAARKLGLKVVLLTDCVELHRQRFSRPELPAYPDEIVACDVFNPIAVIETIARRGARPAAVFSNSDHLQTATAIAAQYWGLPGKDWRVAYRAKNKAEMRRALREQGIDGLWHFPVSDAAALQRAMSGVPFPCVVKPSEGVASQHVSLARDERELATQCQSIWNALPGQQLLIEEYVVGGLYTLETLGTPGRVQVLGGFRVALSAPPQFVELEARWGTGLAPSTEAAVLDQIVRFGIGFGACHTEFVVTDSGPRIIEINYRSIGDQRDFLMQEALDVAYFESVLRVHLGETVEVPCTARRAAAIRYIVAQQSGTLASAPAAFSSSERSVDLRYRPLREAGEYVSLSHSNKDYLGVLRGTGASAGALDDAMGRAAADLQWELRP